MFSAQDFAGLPNVSRETFNDFQSWKELLESWNARINLVSPRAMDDFWARHALDSWQLWAHIPAEAETVLDLGSGAGFPGIAMAIGCKAQGRGRVTLVESAGKKANFLRTVIRRLNLPAEVWADRAEKLIAQPYDVITARAFAPLDRLYGYAQPFWGQSTTGLLLKGENVSEELTQAEKTWISDVEVIPSQTDPNSAVLKVRGLRTKPRDG